MENNNSQGFSMEEYNNFLKQIKAGSPVHKINFTLENPNAIAGMYLITMEDVKPYIYKIADCTEIDNDTLLVFESRHIVECCQILFGSLTILENIINIKITKTKFIEYILELLLSKPLFYYKASNELLNIKDKIVDRTKIKTTNEQKILKNFEYILKKIWFVPYGQIDEIANEAIEEFKKHTGGDISNE